MVSSNAYEILNIAKDISKVYDPPIPLMQIAENELIKVICDDYGDTTFDGITFFEIDTEDFYIHLNTNPNRRNFYESTKGRFTLAHELGHYFIPSHRRGLMDGTLKPHGSINYLTDHSSWQIERDADTFASVLLMPTDSMKDYLKGSFFSFGIIEKIAAKYNVSKSAAAIRYSEIGNTPIVVVYAVDGKIRWVKKSEDFPFKRLRCGSANGDSIPKNSVMGTYFYEHDNSDCRKEEIVFAQDWFDTYYNSDNEREFVEWCIEYNNRALSVIWER